MICRNDPLPVFNMFFSIYPKIQGFVDECVYIYIFFFGVFYTQIQDGPQNWQENDFWEKSPVHSANTLQIKYFVEIALAHTVSEINASWCFKLKFKMAAKSGGKTILVKSCELTDTPCGSKMLSQLL